MLVYSLFRQEGNDLFASAYTYAIERNLNRALWNLQQSIDLDLEIGALKTHPRLELRDNIPNHRVWQAVAEGTRDYPQRYIYRVYEQPLSMRNEYCKPFFDEE